nr:cytochrome P450 716B1-like [Tanacetum cinerariifolium]
MVLFGNLVFWMVVLHGPSANKFIYTCDGNILTNTQPLSISRILGTKNIIELSGHDHKRVRAALVSFLKLEVLKQYVAKVDEEIQHHLQTHWHGKHEVQPLIKTLTFNVICSLLFGIERGPKREKLLPLFPDMIEGVLAIPINLPFTQFNQGIVARKRLVPMLVDLIREKREALEEQNQQGDAHKDLITSLISIRAEDSSTTISDEEIIDNIIVVLVAGYDTTSVLVTFLVRLLANNKLIYSNILKEHEEIANSKSPGVDLTWEDLTKMKYTWRVGSEIMRIYPPAPTAGEYLFDEVQKISTSIFVTDFPEYAKAKDLWNVCKQYGHVVDAFVPGRRTKKGKRFGFVRFIRVLDVDRLVSNLCTLWIGNHHLHANVARFQRSSVPNNSKQTHQNGDPVFKNKEGNINSGHRADQTSYVHVVTWKAKSTEDCEPVMVLDEACLNHQDYSLELLGKVKEFSILANVKVVLGSEGFCDIELNYMGAMVGNTFNMIAAKWGKILYMENLDVGCFHNNSDGEMEGENNVSVVPDMVREEENVQVEVEGNDLKENNSDNPYNLYPLLNKKRNTEKSNNTESLQYPPRFTPCDVKAMGLDKNTTGINESSGVGGKNWIWFLLDQGIGKRNTRSGRGVSMNMVSLNVQGLNPKAKKDWVKEIFVSHKVNFLTLQETKMESITLFDVKCCWGNFPFNHVYSPAVGNSGGILCVWEKLSFKKINSTVIDYFVMISGTWVCSGVNLLIISVYAPQEFSKKKMLLDYLGQFHFECKSLRDSLGRLCIYLVSKIHLEDESFHYWFEIDGFEEMILKAWFESPAIEMIIDEGNATDDMLYKIMEIIKDIQEVDKVDNMEAAQKAKIKWAIEGDENTKYYHGILNNKRNQLAIRGGLKDGIWIENPNLVKSEFLLHFKNRFQKPCSVRPVLDMTFPRQLFAMQQIDIETDGSYQEIKRAVWDCGGDKSSRPDGFTFGFIRRFWSLLEKDILDAKMVKDFGPISLIGSLYKIIAKILANRFVGVLGDIVSEVQSAFVEDRQILDGDVLSQFGFGSRWRGWIQECLRSSRGSVLVNGSATKEFQFYKGLKQGDPLSPFLFILVMESLHLSFKIVEDAGMFNKIMFNSSMLLSHMFYMDDAIFMGQWSNRNIDTLIYMLKCFQRASGLSINLSKSNLMGIAVSVEKVEEVTKNIGCGVLKTPFSFLGLKVGGCMSLIKSWDEVMEKMVNHLLKWKMKTLSIGGRLTLLKAMLGSM